MARKEYPQWGRYELLRPGQIEAIRAHAPIAYLPWGALEWHSYHAPIGLDGLKAHGICLELAKRTGGVVLPPVYIGTDTIKSYKGFPHTLEHAEQTVTQLCREFLLQLADEKFKVIVLITGHYGGGHLKAINQAVDLFRQDQRAVCVWAIPDSEPIEAEYPKDHAARGETCWQLYFQPELVDLSLLPADRQTTLDDDGVWGEDPRSASVDEGKAMLALFLKNAIPKIKHMLEAAK